MKLYTEEQVRKILKSTHIHTDNDVDMILPQFTPIELPSDEEIEEESWRYREVTKDMEIPPNEDWSNGAKWYREQLKNKQL